MCGGAWEVWFRPYVPATNPLILGEVLVGALDCASSACTRVAQNKDGQRRIGLRPLRPAPTDDTTCPHFGLPVECLFEVFRVYVQPGSGDDHIPFAPLEIKIAGVIHCSNV